MTGQASVARAPRLATTDDTPPRRKAGMPPRRAVAASAALVAALGHLPLIAEHRRAAPLLALLLLVLTAGCLHCAGRLLRSSSRSTWALVAAMGSLMVAAHAPVAGLAHEHAGTAGPSALRVVVVLAEGLLLLLAAHALLAARRSA